MSTNEAIVIGCAGLTDNELNALKSVCSISRLSTRPYGFEVAAPGVAAEFVVLADGADGAATASLVCASTRGVLWIGAQAQLDREVPQQVVPRPLLASRLLGTLDRLVESSRATARQARRAAPAAPAFHPAVLVVDDSPTVRKQVELVLTGMDAQVSVAATGESALEMAQRQHFDLVLLDVVLPGTDGYSVCRTLKRNPKTRLTPVVMLTSKASPFDRIRGSLAGCDSYLTKPVIKEDFERTVLRYLQAPAGVFQTAPSLHAA
jgi:two-component system, cell cycle response regulator